ncbi:MAG: YedE-related selenium metabolism membrane protein [Clostridia bacterium]|nr:MAG: YedE-related selenium metabolism membrane protein [Clostridia bacterium]
MTRERALLLFAGGIVGLLAICLVALGNPPNMGFCIACFLRDTAGGLGLHRAAAAQYIRPEILGLALGSFGVAVATREFRPAGGASSLTRFLLGFLVMLGMLVFLGCPLRLVLRLAAGDLNALIGLAGLVAGVAAGNEFLKRGFSLGRANPLRQVNGYVFPALVLAGLVLLLARPAFIFFSQEGPGSMRAPVFVALAAGVAVGVLAQRARLCMVGGIRDFLLFRDTHLLSGFAAVGVVAFAGSLLTGNFHAGFANQPIAHNQFLWNFLGMSLAGMGSVLLGGCPLRQLVLAGEGNTDAAVAILGMLAGAATAHNFGLAASPQGVPLAGQVVVITGIMAVMLLAWFNREPVRA